MLATTGIVALRRNARTLMTRDMELIRKILLEIQARKDLEHREVAIDGYDAVILGRHVELLFRAGLIEGTKSGEIGADYSRIFISDLSWEGHDFVAALENKSVWSKITQSFSATELAGIPLPILRDVGVGLLKEWAKSKVGLS
jgi:hypothetical protein